MEPGREDREHPTVEDLQAQLTEWPQWNPVAKTGSTPQVRTPGHQGRAASMEPGREDREHTGGPAAAAARCRTGASMEPGREDREHITPQVTPQP